MSVKTIVLAAGGGNGDLVDRLAATATDIADPADAEIILAHVFSDAEYDEARDRLNLSQDSEVTPSAIAQRKTDVRDLVDRLTESGLNVTTYGRLAGGASRGERLAEIAEEVDADMVVVGGRDRSPAGKALFGSTSQDVLLEAACPVTFVRAA
jgi:nucleotide-binding universal stress UspA family protein